MDHAADCQPPLRWWSHLWRYLLALVIGVVVWLPVAEAQAEQRPLLFWVDIVLGLLVSVLVWWRRRWPMTIAVLAVLTTPLSSLAGGAVTLTMVSLATRRRWWQVLSIAVLSLMMTALYYWIQPVSTSDTEPGWLTATFSVVVVAATLGWGMYIGSRRELLWTLRQRAETAEAERDLRASRARTTERARIAREMHDVLAHRISQISLHAGALSYREDLSADEMRSGVGLIRIKAHEALTDLREVLGVLRDDDGAVLTGPQPRHADLPVLVEEARTVGAVITYDDDLPLHPPLPDTVARTIYRTVQEGITNAAKHAPAAALQVRLSGSPDLGVEVELRNPLGFGPTSTPGAGLGLIGLAERVELHGGRLTHGTARSPGRSPEFVLHAWLPWPREAEEDQ